MPILGTVSVAAVGPARGKVVELALALRPVRLLGVKSGCADGPGLRSAVGRKAEMIR